MRSSLLRAASHIVDFEVDYRLANGRFYFALRFHRCTMARQIKDDDSKEFCLSKTTNLETSIAKHHVPA